MQGLWSVIQCLISPEDKRLFVLTQAAQRRIVGEFPQELNYEIHKLELQK